MEYELPLLIGGHLGHGADGGIVGCDEWRIYSNEAFLPGVSDHPLCDGCVEKALNGSMDVGYNSYGNAMNSPIFLKLWMHILSTGVHRRHTWVVKTEADVVFAGSRLREYLIALPLGGDGGQLSEPVSLKPTYIRNVHCGPGCWTLWGGVEAVSSSALDRWAAEPAACERWWDFQDGNQEDYWFHGCMREWSEGISGWRAYALQLGALFRDDGSGRGVQHPPCGSEHATFTRMKDAGQWSACFEQIVASNDTEFARTVAGEVAAAKEQQRGWCALNVTAEECAETRGNYPR